jgi:hypothetical protein
MQCKVFMLYPFYAEREFSWWIELRLTSSTLALHIWEKRKTWLFQQLRIVVDMVSNTLHHDPSWNKCEKHGIYKEYLHDWSLSYHSYPLSHSPAFLWHKTSHCSKVSSRAIWGTKLVQMDVKVMSILKVHSHLVLGFLVLSPLTPC